MVRDGFQFLHDHLSYSLAHEIVPEKAVPFPTGDENLDPLTRSVMIVVPCGSKSTGLANDYINAKPGFIVFKPVPLPVSTVTRPVITFYAPNQVGGDSYPPTSAYFTAIGTGGTTFTTVNPSGASYNTLRSRGVFTHVTIAYQGQLQSCTGSLYLHFPPQGGFTSASTADSSGYCFQQVFGEVDSITNPSTQITDNNNVSYPREKKYIITLAKLAELGSISFVIYNELASDYVLQEPTDTPLDIWNQNIGNQSTVGYVNMMGWCDSTTVTDRLRIHVNHHYDVVYSPNNSTTGFHQRGGPRHIAPNHLSHIPDIVNSVHTVLSPDANGATQRVAHAVNQVLSMAQGQSMDIGNEEELDVGHPSFSNFVPAVKQFYATESADNEYYGAAVSVQPEAAAAAPFVEPLFTAHALFDAIVTANRKS
jgi:hypothetical protein